MVNRYLEDPSQVYEDEIHDVIDPMQQTRNTIGSSGGNGITGSRSSVLRFDLGSRSNNIGIDNIIFRGSTSNPYGTKWGSTMGQGAALTYSLSTPASTYVSGASPGLVLDLTVSQVTNIRDVMQQYANISKLTFSEVSDTPTSAGDIRWARSDNRTDVPTSYASYPALGSAPAGDIWIGNNYTVNQNPAKGNYGYYGLIHELGHALGLTHPHEGTIPGAVEEDQLKYSVMSYRDFAGDSLNGVATRYFPTTLMLNDVAAIQYLYGINTNYQTGNNTYNWAANTSVYETIVDAGGNDTIDASNQTQSVLLNLNSGTWSQIGQAFNNSQAYVRDCLTIAYTTTIENATGSAYNDTLIGNAVTNVLDGRAGADNMQGNGGDDIYYVDNAGDVVTENAGQGTDSVYASVNFTLGNNVENLTLTGSAISGTGNALNNVLTGNGQANVLNGAAGDDTLDGGSGSDVLYGGTGNDTYIVDSGSDIINENFGEGIDSIIATTSDRYTLAENVENLTFVGTQAIAATGNSLNNTIIGNIANDVLDGGAGADTLKGMAGNDYYYVDNPGDLAVENNNEGNDTVYSRINYTLGANIEDLMLIDNAIIGTGNELNNNLVGNNLANTLIGGGGNDTLVGEYGGDTLYGGTGDDNYSIKSSDDCVIEYANEGTDTVYTNANYTLSANVENLILCGSTAINGTGNNLNNTIIGNAAANQLDGGAGADILKGMSGNDTYIVDNSGDVVIENTNEGTDTVYASANYSLSANVENLTLTGNASSGTGNARNNVLIGNTYANILNGDAGNDSLDGGAGSDSLYGGLGDDTLDGGAGSDTLYGGLGDDTYLIDSSGDIVNENASEGTDTVKASVSYTLSTNVENLSLTGSATINGTGNSLNNVITGNAAANLLDGGAGADTLNGMGGNDTYSVDNIGDLVIENANEGTDTVNASIAYSLGANIENLTLTGASAINGTGNDLNNLITGNAADNWLNGLGGVDTMIGQSGDDRYFVDNVGDIVVERANEGNDWVDIRGTGVSQYTLPGNVENLQLASTNGNINATGNDLDNFIRGTQQNNVITGGKGNDLLIGQRGSDTYIFNRGDSSDTILEIGRDSSSAAVDVDILKFGSGISANQLWFSKQDYNGSLIVGVIGTSDKVSIEFWYANKETNWSESYIEQFQTADGKTLTYDKVDQLVNAMAAFAPPAMGQTTLPTNYQQALAPVIAAAWA